MKPLVSCIVPVHNGDRFLGPALTSLLEQTWRPIEILVVDDGSTDGSSAIAAAFGSKLRTLRCAAGNPPLARNHGIAQAQGAFLAFLDQDDLCVPDKLQWQMAAFSEDASLEVCVGMVQRFVQTRSEESMRLIGAPVPGYLTISMVARRQVFERIGAFNPANVYSDSAEWFLRARAAGIKIRLLPQLLTYHRDHDRNLSLMEGDQARGEFMRLIKSKLDRERYCS